MVRDLTVQFQPHADAEKDPTADKSSVGGCMYWLIAKDLWAHLSPFL